MSALLDAAALVEELVDGGEITDRYDAALRLLAQHARETLQGHGMTRSKIITLLAIASGHAPPCPDVAAHRVPVGHVSSRPANANEWAEHLMSYARALGRAVDAELASSTETRAAGATSDAEQPDDLYEGMR